MKNRHLAFILCIAIAICTALLVGCNNSTPTAQGETEGNLTYILLSSDTYSVKAKDRDISGEITIPSTFNGKSVTEIATNGFEFCRNGITKIVLPETIKTIGDYAFFYCTATQIEINVGVTTIESGAFSNCTSNFVIPVSVTQIDSYAFQARSSITYAGTAAQWNEIDVAETAIKYNELYPEVKVVCIGDNS